jgi:AefR-like transcriptional repressor, C-terminal domain
MMKGGRVPAIARMVIGESRNFPDLARIWYDDVVASVIGILTAIIARAQARGEVAPGDPRLHAFSLMGPMVIAEGANPPDLQALADTHAGTALRGLLMPTIAQGDARRTK